MKRILMSAAAAATIALSAGASPAVVAAHPPLAAGAATAHKSCSSGWTHATIGGAEKCLRRGQFCARRYKRQYSRYGFHCDKRTAYGWRLT